MTKFVDLRSDTVTRPSPAMRQAMADAEVGDDVYREDPTVRHLEEVAAETVGMDAGLFVPSGTMGNQIAMRLQCRRGHEVLCEENSHVVHYESGGMAALSGLTPRLFVSSDLPLEPATVVSRIRRGDSSQPETDLLVLENTHNVAGGVVSESKVVVDLVAQARERGLNCHLDGARIFHAATAQGVQVSELTSCFDSVMFCLSKGLGAPVGSLLCGRQEFIAEAREVRRLFGGAMRQSGVLAAAGLIALQEGPKRLAVDHTHAQLLAETLSDLPGYEVDPAAVRTNIVIARCSSDEHAAQAVSALRQEGILAGTLLGGRLRLVTHLDIDADQIESARSKITRQLRP